MGTERKVFLNGQFVPESEARISIYDSALMFGDMVFEMTRSFRKEQFRLREHLERLYLGLKILQVPIPMKIDELHSACLETVKANEPSFNDKDEHRLMIDVTRGTLGIYQDTTQGTKGPNVIVADFPLRWTVKGMGKLYEEGINLVIPSQRQIPASLLDPKVKNRNRLHYLMANIQVSQNSGKNNWALLIDPQGFITEGTGSNFLMVKDGKLISPKPTNILRGISRDYVMNVLAPSLGLEVHEADIEPFDVYSADEAFLTATPFCILPVKSLNGIEMKECMGTVTRNLLERWSENVKVNIPGQIQDWEKTAISQDENSPTPYQFRKN